MSHPDPAAAGRPRVWCPRLLLVALTIVAVLGGTVGAVTAAAFTDVGPTHPFATEIEWLVANDVSTGYPDWTFRPNEPVTRQAMAAFLYRLAGADPAITPMVDAATLRGLSPADLAAPEPLWAVIEPGGGLARGNRVVASSSPQQDGWYEVVFDRNVSACAYHATLGTSTPQNLQPGMIAVAPRLMKANAVWVQTFDLNGTSAPRGFHLEVTC